MRACGAAAPACRRSSFSRPAARDNAGNSLRGTLPPSLGTLPSLDSLSARGNRLESPLPVFGSSPGASAPALDLAFNALTDADGLAGALAGAASAELCGNPLNGSLDKVAWPKVTRCVATLPQLGPALQSPAKVAVDAAGNAFVADTGNNRIVVRWANGSSAILAGSGQPGTADGAGAETAFRGPLGVAVDRGGTTVYVADTGNHLIRKVAVPSGAVTTLAGSVRGYADGRAGGDIASFNYPRSVAVGPDGSIYVADTGALLCVVARL